MTLFIAIVGLLFSMLFTSLEIALISANKLQIRVWLKQKKKGARLAYSVFENKEKYLSTILIGTNLSNILATTFATLYLTTTSLNPISIVAIITGFILLIGEIIPKNITREFSNITILFLSPFLYFFGIILSPINYLLSKAGWIIISTDGEVTQTDEIDRERDDLQYLYEQVDAPEAMEDDQRELISNVFEFSDATVEDAMTPRTDISSVSTDDSLEDILHKFIDSGHSKLPIFENDIDNIIGVVHIYDLFKEPEDIRNIIKPILHIPYSKPAMDTLSEFKTAHHAMAIVLDEHGGTDGLVTAEDLFEELFGEFDDEFDLDDSKANQLDDGSILATAKIECDTFNEKYNNLIPDGDFETLAGYIIHETGRIPNKGERLFLSIGQVVIKKATARRIDQIQIFPKK